MRRIADLDISNALRFCALALLVLLSASAGFAQSSDASYPTPVTSSEITGRIAPRDVGDARLTRHFYTFMGNEGDLVITVESTDLNGGVDLFTAGSLRPLTKITLYAGASLATATKSIYLRLQEPLVLRVEGRSAGDTDAVYRIRFEGAFTPLSGALAQTSEPVTPTLSEPTGRDPNVRRVNSVGARIDEPAPVSPAAPADGDTASTPAAEARETAAAKPTVRRGATPPRRTRPARPNRSATRRTNPTGAGERAENSDAVTPRPSGPAEAGTTNETSGANEAASTTTTAPRNTKAARTKTPRRTRKNNQPAEQTAAADVPADAAPSAPNAAPAAATSPRLIIVTRDGETVERFMSTVRRVTVENNQIVVIGKDGKVTRQPLANVVRMAIEP